MRTPVRAALAALGVLVLATMAGCGGSGDSRAAEEPSVTTSPSPTTPSESATPTPSETTSASPSAPTATPPAAPERCRLADVRFSVSAGDAAMGSVYSDLVMTNTSSAPCVTGGFGGVSYVDGAGQQVGAAAERDPAVKVTRILLRPGQKAVAQLQEGEAQNYPQGQCRQTPVAGLRIYPPDETHAVVVKHRATGCAASGITLLQLQAYRAG